MDLTEEQLFAEYKRLYGKRISDDTKFVNESFKHDSQDILYEPILVNEPNSEEFNCRYGVHIHYNPKSEQLNFFIIEAERYFGKPGYNQYEPELSYNKEPDYFKPLKLKDMVMNLDWEVSYELFRLSILSDADKKVNEFYTSKKTKELEQYKKEYVKYNRIDASEELNKDEQCILYQELSVLDRKSNKDLDISYDAYYNPINEKVNIYISQPEDDSTKKPDISIYYPITSMIDNLCADIETDDPTNQMESELSDYVIDAFDEYFNKEYKEEQRQKEIKKWERAHLYGQFGDREI